MSVVYLLASNGKDIISLDQEASVQLSYTDTLTTSSVMSGVQIADGYILGNKSVKISGLSSYTKIQREYSDTPPTPAELHVILDELRSSGTRYTLYGNSLIPDLEDVVITSFSAVQDKYQNAIRVELVLTQAFIASTAVVTQVFVPKKEEEEKVTDSSNTKNVTSSKSTVSSEWNSVYYAQLMGIY